MKRIIFGLIAFLAAINVALAGMNINTASESELESLKGIGPVKAKAIIDYRNQHGPFKSLDDLDKVKGIGTGTLDKIRNDITVNGVSGAKAPVKPARGNPYLLDEPAPPVAPAKPVAPAPVQPVKPMFPVTTSVVKTGGSHTPSKKGNVQSGKVGGQ